jgi:hypothetical protein
VLSETGRTHSDGWVCREGTASLQVGLDPVSNFMLDLID